MTAVRVDQPDGVLVDPVEPFGFDDADDAERGDADEEEHGGPDQQVPGAGRRRPARGRGLGVRRGGQVERRILGEDVVVQAPEVGSRLDADLFHERGARVAVGLERLGLPAAAVEREHPLAVHVLAQRVLGGQRVELADHLGVSPGLQVGVDRHLGGAQAQFFEAADLGGRERLLGEVCQWLTAPQRERVARQALVEQPLGQQDVDHALGDLQLVPAPVGHDPDAVLPEHASQVRHVELHHLRPARRRLVAPEPFREMVRGDRAARLQGQHREHRPLLAGAEIE